MCFSNSNKYYVYHNNSLFNLYLSIFSKELEEYSKSGLIKLHTAFSRDQPKKIYVTHLLEKNADELWNVIGVNNGHVYICG